MKFARLLLSSMIPEWIKLYLNYKLLKTYLSSSAFIKKNLRQLKIKFVRKKKIYSERKYEILQIEQVKEKIQKDLQGFSITIKEDMIKMESFIIWKYQDIQKKNQKLKEQIIFMKKQKEHLELQQIIGGDENKYVAEGKEFKKQQYILKQTLYQFIIEISQFKNYIAINHQGLIKILKKYKKCTISRLRNKELEQDSLGEVMQDIILLKKLPERLQKQANNIEKLLLHNFYQLNPKKGRYNLRKYQEHKIIKGNVLFEFGLFIGFAIVLVTFIFLLRIEGQIDPDNLSNEHSIFQKMFPCFRGIALFIIYYWFLSFDLWGWTHFRINYKIYLGFNHHFSTVAEVLRRVSYLSTLFLIFFIAYIPQAENITPFEYEQYTKYLPLILWSILFFYVFFPFTKLLNGPGRIWMYNMLAGALYGHFIKYESRFTFCVDQFISMVTPLRDLDYTICYYQTYWRTGQIHDGRCFYQNRISGALIVIIPYSIKAIHYITRARDKGKFWHTDEMWNFFKTLFAVMVATLSYLAKKNVLFRIIWIPAAACCSLFQFWWDLKKDWLFFEKGSNVRFLRNDLGYNHPAIYYAIGISNFFLRLTWILSISPDMYIYFGLSNKELFIFVIGFLEMTRRLINNFIKIEKEYITNLRSLKTTMEFQYPFKQRDTQNFQIISERITLSTLNLNEKEEDLTQLLRITNCQLEKSDQNNRSDLNKSDCLFQDYKLDLEILDKAKKQEKFQQSKIKELKLENKEFYRLEIFQEFFSNK